MYPDVQTGVRELECMGVGRGACTHLGYSGRKFVNLLYASLKSVCFRHPKLWTKLSHDVCGQFSQVDFSAVKTDIL